MPTTDAHRDDPAFDAVTLHGMEQAGGLNGTSRADRMTMGDRVTFHIDDVFWQSKITCHGNRDRGECLVDFEPLDLTDRPIRALQGLFDGRNGTDAEHARLDSANAPAHQSAQGALGCSSRPTHAQPEASLPRPY